MACCPALFKSPGSGRLPEKNAYFVRSNLVGDVTPHREAIDAGLAPKGIAEIVRYASSSDGNSQIQRLFLEVCQLLVGGRLPHDERVRTRLVGRIEIVPGSVERIELVGGKGTPVEQRIECESSRTGTAAPVPSRCRDSRVQFGIERVAVAGNVDGPVVVGAAIVIDDVVAPVEALETGAVPPSFSGAESRARCLRRSSPPSRSRRPRRGTTDLSQNHAAIHGLSLCSSLNSAWRSTVPLPVPTVTVRAASQAARGGSPAQRRSTTELPGAQGLRLLVSV